MSLADIFKGVGNIQPEDIEQDNAGGKTTLKLNKKAYEWVRDAIDEGEDKDWVLSISKKKGKVVVESKWTTIFELKKE